MVIFHCYVSSPEGNLISCSVRFPMFCDGAVSDQPGWSGTVLRDGRMAGGVQMFAMPIHAPVMVLFMWGK